ncbi:MAG: DUF1800 family protein [Granulosicoccus sp.]
MKTPSPFDLSGTNSASSVQERPASEPQISAQLNDSANVSAEDASRFLSQAGFGGTDKEIARVIRLGYIEWIDAEIRRSSGSKRFNWLKQAGYLEESKRRGGSGDFERVSWKRMIVGNDVLRQRMTLALSEIFVVNPSNMPKTGGFKGAGAAAYLDMLDRLGFGSYRELLGAVTTSLQMGTYLSMRGSRRADGTGRAPDENYAREILQLFSIGLVDLRSDGTALLDANGQSRESYTQDDIIGLAAVFTGWDHSEVRPSRSGADFWNQPMRFIPRYHDNREKRFLGTIIPAGTDGVTALNLALDRIASHPNVPPFISRQLIQRFVTSNPTPAYVQRIAGVFLDDGNGRRGQLGAVLKAILLDDEARIQPTGQQALTYGKVREPVVRFVQWARTFRLNGVSGVWPIRDLSDPSDELAQSPLRSNSVFNFFRPGYSPPNTNLSSQNLVAPELQITNETSVVGYANYMHRVIEKGVGMLKPNYSKELRLAARPAELVSHLDTLLVGGALSYETWQTIVNALDAMKSKTRAHRLRRVHAAILLIMVSPDYLIQR